jgi:hypothetical protein
MLSVSRKRREAEAMTDRATGQSEIEYKVRYIRDGEVCVVPRIEYSARVSFREELRAAGVRSTIAFRVMRPEEIEAHVLGYQVVWNWRRGDGFQRCEEAAPRSGRRGVAQPKAVIYDDPDSLEKACVYASSGRRAEAIARELKASSILAVEVRPATPAEVAKLAAGELEYTEPEGS